MSVNISKKEREELIEKILVLKEYIKSSPEDKNRNNLLSYIAEIEKDIKGKKYGLVFEEHKENIDEILENNVPVLKEDESLFIDNGGQMNFLIEGDNLASLKLLEKTHKGKIDVIYIDPPYNTGNEDFIYSDDYVDKTDSFRHSMWLSFIEKRLKIANKLLTNCGVIFISIDDNEQANLKLLCDKIYGEENFIANIIRNTNSSKNNSLFVSVSHEYCLVYAKNIEYLKLKHSNNKWNVPKNNVKEYLKIVDKLKKRGLSNEEITEELKILTQYPRFIDFTNYWYIDDKGLYRKGDLGGVKNGNNNPIFNPLTNKYDPIPPGGFRFDQEKLQKLINENKIHFHTDGSLPTIKRYLSEAEGQRPKSIMSDDQRPDVFLLNKLDIHFDNPKQLSFMKRILSVVDNNSTILDFFAGSGTTGHAIMKLNAEDGGNRKFILCTNNEIDVKNTLRYLQDNGYLTDYKIKQDTASSAIKNKYEKFLNKNPDVFQKLFVDNKNEYEKYGICRNITYERIKRVIEKEKYNASLKYMKVDFVPITDKFYYEYADELLKNVKELVELENGVNFNGNKELAIVLTEDELDEFTKDIPDECKVIYLGHDILQTPEQKVLFKEKNIKVNIIPKYYKEEK